MRSLDIDVISDVVCPWCLIGTRHLDLALEGLPDVNATVRFRPFLLDPSTPPEGVDLRERLRSKYGGDPEAMFGRVEGAARAAGIPLDFAKIRRSVNTVRAHTLLRLALGSGDGAGITKQGEVARALFRAYFLEGRDIGQVDVLTAIAPEHGLDKAEARRVVTDDAELARTRKEASEASAKGITGVPFFILDGRLALSGAQPPATLRAAIERALAPD
jgi:predicted DsbA family dithiol-disulfide isomerase